jgi:hypothetical protein
MSTGRYCFFILPEIRVSRQIFIKVSNIKFQEYPSSGSSIDICDETEGQIDTTKLIAAFRHLCECD